MARVAMVVIFASSICSTIAAVSSSPASTKISPVSSLMRSLAA
jgi:hypothetical protein